MTTGSEIAGGAAEATGRPRASIPVQMIKRQVKTLPREDRGSDIVVIGGGGHEGSTDLLLGTTAERIVKHSPVPVLVVK